MDDYAPQTNEPAGSVPKVFRRSICTPFSTGPDLVILTDHLDAVRLFRSDMEENKMRIKPATGGPSVLHFTPQASV